MTNQNQIKKSISNFLDYLKTNNGLGNQTIQNYNFYLNRFLSWSKLNQPQQINSELIEKFKNFLAHQNQKGLKDSTKNYHLIALRSFLKYLKQNKTAVFDWKKIKLEKIPKTKKEFLNKDEIARLLAAPLRTKEEKIIQLRDKAILELLFCSGLRVSELSGLKKNQIDFAKDELPVLSKNKKRSVYLSNQSRYYLKEYLKQRKSSSPYLFIRHDRAADNKPNNLTSRSIQRLLERYARVAGLTKKITPRILRRNFAFNLLNQGDDVKSIQKIMGHQTLSVTKNYLD